MEQLVARQAHNLEAVGANPTTALLFKPVIKEHMTDSLIPAGELSVSKYSDKDFDAIAKGGNWIPRVQLQSAGSNLVKEDKIKQGYYALLKDKENFLDLTNSFDCLVISWRPKAMRIDGETVISVQNPQSPEFEKIIAESETPDSGCMYGPEFLLWIKGASQFATFFMSSKTMRREAPNLKTLIGKAATIRSKLIKTQKFSWFGPVVGPCSTPFDIPGLDEIKDQAQKFNNPSEKEVETAKDDGRAR